jgi:hypothetical protein
VQVWGPALGVRAADAGKWRGAKPKYHEVTYDDTPIDLHAADIEDRLKREGPQTLRGLLLGRKSRSEMVGVLPRAAELIREKKILVEQTDDQSDVQIITAREHRKTTSARRWRWPTKSKRLAGGRRDPRPRPEAESEPAAETSRAS